MSWSESSCRGALYPLAWHHRQVQGTNVTNPFSLGPKQGGETNNEYRSVIERKLKNVVGVGGDDDADDEQEVSWFTKQYRRLKANFPGPLSFLEEIFDERRKSKIIVEIMIFMFIMPITGILLYFSTFADEVFAIHCSAETGKQLYLVLMVAPPLLLIPYYGLTLCESSKTLHGKNSERCA